MRESIFRCEVRDMIDEIRCEGAKRLSPSSEQYAKVVREADAENDNMKQFVVEQQLEAEKLNMRLCTEMQASQGATATHDISALKSSIAKHESAYSSVCGALVTERASCTSDADQVQTMRRIHEET